jgi:hypothetical protein
VDPDPGARKIRNFSGKMHFLVIKKKSRLRAILHSSELRLRATLHSMGSQLPAMWHSAELIFVVEYLCEFKSICKTVLAHESGDPEVQFNEKKPKGKKSLDTVPLTAELWTQIRTENWIIPDKINST